jgi:phosphoribosylaminoimidazolecarboxamide formyltransferase/IMP cyclohydrolase
MNIKRAFISVHDKTNIEKLALFLTRYGTEIVATDHTAEYLQSYGVPAVKVADYSGFPSIFDGRLKSIHPKVMGGILAIQDSKNHQKEMKEHDIQPFDLVVVNLKPFEMSVDESPEESNLSKEIDISGPALLMAAAKNHRDVVVISEIEDYDEVIESLEYCGDVLLLKRRRYALKAIHDVMLYTASVHKALSQIFASEKYDYTIMEYIMPLLYGDNPSQKASLMKISTEPGLLDEVQIANPAVGLKKSQLRNTNVFMELYYYSDNISVFLDKGKIVKVSSSTSLEDIDYGGPDTMFASTFTIGEDTIRKLSDKGIESFCGVFDRDAIKLARERDIMILTVPERAAVELSHETYSGFGNYFVREAAFRMRTIDLEPDGKLAVYCSRVNRANNISAFRDGESLLLKSGLSYREFRELDYSSYNLSGATLASNVDLDDATLNALEKAGISKIILPGTAGSYSGKSLIALGFEFTRLNN